MSAPRSIAPTCAAAPLVSLAAASREAFAERITLRDGSTAVIRPLEPGEPAAIESWFMALQPHTRYERFHAALNRLDPRTLAELAQIDHRRHEALGAITPDDAVVGIARYIRLADAVEAEVAVTVIERWQRRGIATLLLNRLAGMARAAGVRRFKGTCLATNYAAIRLVCKLGATSVAASDAGVLDVRIELAGENAGGTATSEQALRTRSSRGAVAVSPDGASVALHTAKVGQATPESDCV
jgi:GNAT superfamily N-acetyltransferase